MATVLAEKDLPAAAPSPARGELVPFRGNGAAPRDLAEKAMAGVQQLRAMSPDQLRALIAERVALLEGELKEREARRAALEEARAAQRMLEVRRRRAQAIRRRVNVASSMAVAMFAGVVVVHLF